MIPVEFLFDNNSNNLSDGFIRFLIHKLKIIMISNLNAKKVRAFNDRFRKYSTDVGWLTDRESQQFDARRLILNSLNRIRFRRTKNGYVIYFDVDIPYISPKHSMQTFCNVLNYGTLEIPGFPIYTKSINILYKNMNRFYMEYNKMMFGGMFKNVYSII